MRLVRPHSVEELLVDDRVALDDHQGIGKRFFQKRVQIDGLIRRDVLPGLLPSP